MKKINWELQDVASKINAKVLVTTAALNDAWRSELLALNLPNEVLNRLWLETSYFGTFLLLKKFSAPLAREDGEFLDDAVRNAFLFTVPVAVFGDAKSENADFKKYIRSEYDNRLEIYRSNKAVDTRALFRDLIKNVFNTTEDSKVKFINKTRGLRLKLWLAFALAALGGNKEFIEKHASEVYFADENLVAIADGATRAFAGISESDVRD